MAASGWPTAEHSVNVAFTQLCSVTTPQSSSIASGSATERILIMLKHIATTALAALFSATVAYALPGDGDSGATSKPKPAISSPKKLKCKSTETAKRVKRSGKYVMACVKLQAGVLPDDALYQNARLLADEGEYEWALDHLRLIHNQQDKEVLNYTGYANRKAGRVETGISYYQKALALDPDYVQAREYLGEAYMLVGFRPQAEEQLREIGKRCAPDCKAYVTLQGFIEQYSY
jgi:tetratricopeptide (TPR) repeat protein